MELRNVFTVFRKEMLEVMRDWRTVFVMLVLPVILYPLLIVVVSQLSVHQAQKLEQEASRIVIRGAEGNEDLVNKLLEKENIERIDEVSGSLEHALQTEQIQAAVVIQKNLQTVYAEEIAGEIKVMYDAARDRSRAAFNKIRSVVDAYEKQLQKELLDRKGLPDVYRKPLRTEVVSVASSRQRGRALAAKFLPYLLIIMTLMGGLYPAVDLTAGEKERKTIETLLVSPGTRLELVTGKYVTVFLISLVTAGLNLMSMGVTFSKFLPLGELSSKIQFNLTFDLAGIVMLIMIPLAALFSGLVIAIASFAKSYREGTMYTTPLVIVCVLPAMVTTLPGMELTVVNAFVPVMNASLLFKHLMVPPVQWLPVVLSLVSTSVYAGLAIALSAYLFSREDILLPESEGFPLRVPWRTGEGQSTRETPAISHLVFTLSATMGLMLYAGGIVQKQWGIVPELMVTQLVFVLAPCVLMTWLGGLDWRKTFVPCRPPAGDFLRGLATGVFMLGIIFFVHQLLLWWFPGLASSMEKYQQMFDTSVSFGGMLFCVAVLAPVCEEALFRGFLLTGFRERMSPFWAVLGIGLLFGLYHLVLLKVITTGLAGVILAILVIRTGSVWPSVLAHAVFNGSMFLMSQYRSFLHDMLPNLSRVLTSSSPGIVTFLTGVICLAGLYYLLRS